MRETRAQGGTELQLASWRAHVPVNLQSQVHLSVSAVAKPQRPLKPHIFWAHQAHDQPSVQNLADPLVQRGIDAFVFVSKWQREQYIKYLGVPPESTYVIRNAIEPIVPHTKPAGPLQLVYTSTPFRGLDVLLETFPTLSARYDVELHIFSGMALYGRSEEDTRFAPLYAKAQALPKVHYHGVVPNKDLREALLDSHIFAYPCTWEETSCIALIEAMSAGCLAVVPSLAALPETGIDFASVYPYVADKATHKDQFSSALEEAIRGYYEPATQAKLAAQVAHFAHEYSWATRKEEWVVLLERVIATYGRHI